MNRSRRLATRRSIGARRRRTRRAPSSGFEMDASLGLPASDADRRSEGAVAPGSPETAVGAPGPGTPPRD
jgi:hypothetical protein